jgi:hypothetical protein
MLAARSPTTRTVLSYFRIIETGAVARPICNAAAGPAVPENHKNFYELGGQSGDLLGLKRHPFY